MATGTRNKVTPVASSTRGRNAVGGPAQAAKGIDFTSLTVEDADTSALTRTGASMLDGTPVLEWIETNWSKRQAGTRSNGTPAEFGPVQTVTVPEAQVGGMIALLEAGAKRVGCGLAKTPGKPVSGKVAIAYRTQTKVAGVGRPKGSKNKTN